MEPLIIQRRGRTFANAEAVARSLGILAETWRNRVATGRPITNPPPAHVMRDPDTGVKMWDIADVVKWDRSRRGKGFRGPAPATQARRLPRTPTRVSNSSGYIPGEGV